jgi:hypothetical protein
MAYGTTLLVRDGLWDNTAGQGLLAHFISAKIIRGSNEGKHFRFLN